MAKEGMTTYTFPISKLDHKALRLHSVEMRMTTAEVLRQIISKYLIEQGIKPDVIKEMNEE